MQPTSNQQPATSNQQPATSNQQPTTNNQQPTTNNQQPTTNNQQPTTNNQQPTTNNQQPTTNNTNEKVIKHKVGLLNLADELGNISQACRLMGASRDTFYRYKKAADTNGIQALFDENRRKPNLKNRVDIETENKVVEFAVEYPAYGQTRASNELRKQGTFVSASGVRSIWLRHHLACFKDRLKALEAKVAQGILS